MGIDPRKFGPTRGELWFWLLFSVFGLGLLAVAFVVRGFPVGAALFEVAGIAGGFLIWMLVRSVRRLAKGLHP